MTSIDTQSNTMTKCEILLEKATKVTTKERDQVKDTKFYYKSANTVKYDICSSAVIAKTITTDKGGRNDAIS